MNNTIKTLVAQLAAFDETAIAALEHAAQDEFRKFRNVNYPKDKANQEAAYILMTAARDIQRIATARDSNGVPATARVVRIKDSGKYYTAEKWRIPENAHCPRDMDNSPDARLENGGIYIVPAQYPWGYEEMINPPTR